MGPAICLLIVKSINSKEYVDKYDMDSDDHRHGAEHDHPADA